MRVKTNSTIEEINQSISNLVAQWGVTPDDNEIIFNKIVGLQIKKICEYLSVDISYFTKPIDDANLILNKTGRVSNVYQFNNRYVAR